jgi:hypothetical protein
MIQYATISRLVQSGQMTWVFVGPDGGHTENGNLAQLLNQVGREDWELIIGFDFVGTAAPELILKRHRQSAVIAGLPKDHKADV